ncbi:hypothetical protein RQC66_44850, partial [Streptomyces justiciae]|nr:hypothetical protein [Streptomyces justiciae]
MQALLNRAAATQIEVGRRPLSVYDEVTDTRLSPPTSRRRSRLERADRNRLRTTASGLGLPHLTETITEYTRRADETKMGYLDFLILQQHFGVFPGQGRLGRV